jgi:anti-sigma-K factor RskA
MTVSQDNIVLAAEYVLGTLDAVEIDLAQKLIEADPEFAALVRDWERRLGELNVMVGAVEPPAGTFDKLRARDASAPQSGAMHLPDPSVQRPLPRLGSAPQLDMSVRPVRPPAPGQASAGDGFIAPPSEARGEVIVLARRVRSSRRVAGLLAAVAAAVCAVFVTSLTRPELLPEQLRPRPQVVEVVRTVEKEVEKPAADRPNRFVAVMQRDSVSPAFILTVDLESRTMTVRKVAAEAQPDKSYELWLVSSTLGAPRSLGLVGENEFTRASQLATYEPTTISDAVYAISLEPTGGSPTGQPTGPVLWTGKLIEAVPPR